VYADAVEKAQAGVGVKVGLVGCHGQTVYHQGKAEKYLGKAVRATWQMGEAAVIAERLRVPVVSDLRPADLAAGGQGAPLVPMLDYCMFRSAKVSRVLQNLGGIGNLTAIPAGAGVDGMMAFDTGPGNMVIDGCMRRLYEREFDRGGAVARTGRVLQEVVARVLKERYFSALPPKSCGREQFGEAFVSRFVAMCRKSDGLDEDVIATATALTAASVVDAYRRFVAGHLERTAGLAKVEFVVAGGGAKNASLMGMLRDGFSPLGVKVRLMEELGVPAQAKEAVAFALLAWLSWWGLPGNVPAATGATRAVVLGKVSRG
jgi:anhydro-N-acetylmuramic acid kinase